MSRIDRAQIIIGSRAEFTVELVDEEGRCFDISEYASGKAVFCNCDGERIESTLSIPGLSPAKGFLPVTLTAVQTSELDTRSLNFDIELVDSSGDITVIPINNKLEVIERNCPPLP